MNTELLSERGREELSDTISCANRLVLLWLLAALPALMRQIKYETNGRGFLFIGRPKHMFLVL